MNRTARTVGRFAAIRAVSLFVAVIIAVYLTVMIANLGGHVDQYRISQIQFEVSQAVYNNPANRALPQEELDQLVEDRVNLEIRNRGLDRPFIERSFSYLWNAMMLDLGRSDYLVSDTASRLVSSVITDRLPSTLLLMATSNLLMFLIALLVALFLSRRYGSALDRILVGLAPISTAPAWFYGLFLIVIFAGVLRVLPWGGMVDAPPPQQTWPYALSVAKHLVLPVGAILLSLIFANIYTWRTFFLIYSSEDYVELARAKGLPSGAIERKYILRPTLPTILTSFMLLIITLWLGAIILETVFMWPGLGRLFYQAIVVSDTPVIVGVIVIYGYLLAASVFLLEFTYAVLDPRVRVTGGRA
jgi:peptide/nickel transport system permease protein